MVELKLILMPPLKRSGRVKAFLENTTRRVEIFQKSRLGLDSSLEGRFIILHQNQLGSTTLTNSLMGIYNKKGHPLDNRRKRLSYSIKKAWDPLSNLEVLRKPKNTDKFAHANA